MNFFSRERAGDMYFTGLLLLAVALPLSLFAMSIAQFVLLASFIIERNYRQRMQQFLLNLPALAITGIYIMHLIGLAWTDDFSWGKHDIVMKLPLLILPFLISSSPLLSKKRFEILMSVFVLSVFMGSLTAVAVLTGIISRPINDIRDIFIFGISHIRFALLTCVSIFSITYFLYKNFQTWSMLKKISASFLAAWFIVFLIIAESVTGLFILLAVTLITCIYLLAKNKNWRVSSVIIFFLLIFGALAYSFLHNAYHQLNIVHHEDLTKLETKTQKGNSYAHDTTSGERENGYLTWIYVCENELKESWNKRSEIQFDSLDRRGQWLKYTLVRFLTSKGLRKDADGVWQLTDEEVHSVEQGIANINYQGASNLRARILQMFIEYNTFVEGGNPSGYSVAQRAEYWKAALGIFKENIFFGVGTGDIVHAYPSQYEKMNSRLEPNLRLRAHNQYLTFAATFGIFGLLYFIFALTFPMRSLKKSRDFLYLTFWIVAVLSMISEDTLETQAGVTFFAFFNCLFLFARDDGE
ncbi:MAG TPA: O-antigen ligase family protein [Bacteroidia bacterium]|nr:O-antigen ligase family protein [Bacteroidia bacterium]